MRRQILVLARAVLAGWISLLLMISLIAHFLLVSAGLFLGPEWLETAKLALDCVFLAGAGWIVGRLGGRKAVFIFATSLVFWNFGDRLAVNVPWLLRLTVNSLRDTRYLESL